jgi:hypothetical protein
MDAPYFRVSSDRQTTEDQFDELIDLASNRAPHREYGVPRLHPRQVLLFFIRSR